MNKVPYGSPLPPKPEPEVRVVERTKNATFGQCLFVAFFFFIYGLFVHIALRYV